MSFLPDHEIAALGEALIQPFYPDCVEPASIDLHLSNEFLVPDTANVRCVDLNDPVDFMKHVVVGDDGYRAASQRVHPRCY